MLTMIRRSQAFLVWAGMLAGVLAVAGCRPPRYIDYPSEFGDYTVQVPWGWDVYLDQQGEEYAAYTFVGPFDPDFFGGVPSLSIRWHKTNRPHILRNGRAESYSSAVDYIEQTLDVVYGYDRKMVQNTHGVSVSGREALHFIVESVAEVPEAYTFGVSIEPGSNRHGVIRRHEYVVLPMDSGFYVLIYPATLQGYDKHAKKYNNMVRTFRVKSDGPGGEKPR